jgi:hypothetical protein
MAGAAAFNEAEQCLAVLERFPLKLLFVQHGEVGSSIERRLLEVAVNKNARSFMYT